MAAMTLPSYSPPPDPVPCWGQVWTGSSAQVLIRGCCVLGWDLGSFSGAEQMLVGPWLWFLGANFPLWLLLRWGKCFFSIWDLDVAQSSGELPETGWSFHGQLTSLDFCHVITKWCEGKALCFRLTGWKPKLSWSNPDPAADPDPVYLDSLKQSGITTNPPLPQPSWRRWALVYFIYCDSLY